MDTDAPIPPSVGTPGADASRPLVERLTATLRTLAAVERRRHAAAPSGWVQVTGFTPGGLRRWVPNDLGTEQDRQARSALADTLDAAGVDRMHLTVDHRHVALWAPDGSPLICLPEPEADTGANDFRPLVLLADAAIATSPTQVILPKRPTVDLTAHERALAEACRARYFAAGGPADMLGVITAALKAERLVIKPTAAGVLFGERDAFATLKPHRVVRATAFTADTLGAPTTPCAS